MSIKIGPFLVARASEDDLRCLVQIVGMCDALADGWMPDSVLNEPLEVFHADDPEQCTRILAKLVEVAQGASANRAMLNLRVLLDPKTAVLTPEADMLELHPRLVQALQDAQQAEASGWTSLAEPGQIQPGDFLSFTVGGKPICAPAQQVLFPGTDREEVVYNRQQNHYFITTMAVDGTSSHKGVFVRSAAKIEATS